MRTGGDPGFTQFADDFAVYLDHAGAADLRRSVLSHARRMASALQDEVLLARRTAEMRSSDAEQRVQAFASRLAAGAGSAPRRRRDRGSGVEAHACGAESLDERLIAELRSELEAVRLAAANLLGLDLTVAEPAQHLESDRRFFYQVAEQAGQTELLAGAIRRRLPGDAGRNRARQHLLREASTLVARQIGRARADLQYRLTEATRRLVDAIDARYVAGTGRLENALAKADALRSGTAEEVAAHQLEHSRRLAAIDRVCTLLDGRPQARASLLGSSPDAATTG